MLDQPRLNSDPLLFAAVFQRIGDQILHCTGKSGEIAHDSGQVRFHLLFHEELGRPNEASRAGKRRVENLWYAPADARTVALMALPDRGKEQNLLDHFE